MKRIFALLLVTILMLSGCTGGGNDLGTMQNSSSNQIEQMEQQVTENHTVVDHDGVEVKLPEQIDRIVVGDVGPMVSVLTLFLGSGESIVGMSPMSMSAAENGILGELFPELMDADTSFLQGSNINVEKLLTLEPDLVLIQSGQSEARTQLENAGLTVVAFGVGTFKYPEHAMELSDSVLLLRREGSAVFGEVHKVMTEENLQDAFGVRVYIRTVPLENRSYTCVIPGSRTD